MADILTLDAHAREQAGKGAARATRRAGLVPAVIYGDRKEPVLVAMDPRDVKRELNTGRFFVHQYKISVNGQEHRVMARDVQLHPITDLPEHVDFLRVTGKTKVTVDVPCNFVNEEQSPGLERGGVLNIVRHAVEVHAQVDSIPEELRIDLAGLDIGDSVHISMVGLPEGVEPTIKDRDFTIATIAAPTIEVEPVEEEVEGEEGELAEGEEAEVETEEGEGGAEAEESAESE